MDDVFKALSDPHRRQLLDRLNQRNGQTLQELCAGMEMARQSVTKHLAVLEAAGLVTTARQGREKLHYLNAAPISDIADRWIGQYHRQHARALSNLKLTLEDRTMSAPEFVYTTYIKTTPERLWAALTDPVFTMRYWGTELTSDWKKGSPLLWGTEREDLGQMILESDPFTRLSYGWHNYQPSHATFFGWSDEQLAQLQREKLTKVTFTLEPANQAVKLTVVHDGFQDDTEMLKAISGRKPQTGGWPEILANLKTLLETGEVLAPTP
jgi:uncharacterized protein YndB with AHSA1/START domain/DNA-binding transcriptional ArsR family regulator